MPCDRVFEQAVHSTTHKASFPVACISSPTYMFT